MSTDRSSAGNAFEQGMALCGQGALEAAADVACAFAQTNPDRGAKTDLACWDEFERRHPLVFSGMYQFWAQKKAD